MSQVWFATDEDGHIAAFWRFEGAALPHAARIMRESRVGEVEAAHALRTTTHSIEHEIHKRIRAGELVEGENPSNLKHQAQLGGNADILLFLQSREAAQSFGLHDILSATSGVAALLPPGDDALLARIHQQGACHGCFYHTTDDEPPGCFFLYTDDDRIAGNLVDPPYSSSNGPSLTHPITLLECPADLREAALRVRIPTPCFSLTRLIQPWEFTSCCDSPSVAYETSSEDAILAIPGRESAFRAHLDKLLRTLTFDQAAKVQTPPRSGPGAQPVI